MTHQGAGHLSIPTSLVCIRGLDRSPRRNRSGVPHFPYLTVWTPHFRPQEPLISRVQPDIVRGEPLLAEYAVTMSQVNYEEWGAEEPMSVDLEIQSNGVSYRYADLIIKSSGLSWGRKSDGGNLKSSAYP